MTDPQDELLRRRVKAEIRKRMRGVRNAAPASACRERSARIEERLVAHPAFTAARRVALFWPIEGRHEVDLRSLDQALRERGVAVAYPSIAPLDDTLGLEPPAPRPMTFRWIDDVAALLERGNGFAEPDPAAPEVQAGELDAIIVPAIAVDPAGHRIGYGAGYYDRTLPRFAPPAVTFVVAYDYQLIAEVPVTPADVRTDVVVTDRRVLEAADES